jgi:hypothetical protein
VLPLAHVGHYAIWILYVVPVLIVGAAIVKSFVSQRREFSDPPAGGTEGEVEDVDLARRPPPL